MTDISQELQDRMVALVRGVAEWNPEGWATQQLCGAASRATEARAIFALLPKPVDPDLIEARTLVECTVHWSPQTDKEIASGKNDNTPEVRIALAAIKRGRELAEQGK